jgi:uncharacterized coiled-coil protein SlyX
VESNVTMNLSQVILESDSKPATEKHKKTAEEFLLHKQVLDAHRAQEASEGLRKRAINYSLEVAVAGYQVPKSGSILDGMPVTTPDIACALADKIGFLVMPYAYLAKSFYPPYTQANAIEKLQEAKLRLYVMAPVGAYDLFKHVATHDEPMFVPKDLTQAFTALGMSIPMFRSMQAQLKELRDQYNEQRNRMHRLEQDMRALSARVDALAEQAAQDRAENKKAAEALQAWYQDQSDPLVLVLPSDTTLKTAKVAFVGPCWGELPAAIANLFDLTSRKELAP